MFNLLRTAATLTLALTTGLAFSQTTNSSPYSRYGLGDLNTPGTTGQFSMGGIGTGYADGTFINLSNPAAGTFLEKPTFAFGIRRNALTLSNGTETQKLTTSYVDHFVYAFPVKKKYALTVGLTPYSRVGYSLKSSKQLDDTTTISMTYKGNGGLNKAFLGNSFRVYNHKDSTTLTLGANVNFLFGTISREARAYFDQSENYMSSRVNEYTTLRDLTFDFGAYYSFYPNKSKALKWNFGATYSLASSVNAALESNIQTFIQGLSKAEYAVDTVLYLKDDNASINIPQSLSLGSSLVLNDNLVIAVDYRMQSWSKFSQTISNASIKDNLSNSSQLALGIQYTPKVVVSPNTSVFKFVNYRAGFRRDMSYINVNGKQISGTGFSAGFAFPLKKSNSLSRLVFGYEYYMRGTTSNGLLKENYSTFNFGVSLTPDFRDRWFYKRKFD